MKPTLALGTALSTLSTRARKASAGLALVLLAVGAVAAPQPASAARILVLAQEFEDGVRIEWSGALDLEGIRTRSRVRDATLLNARRGKLASLDGRLTSAKWKTRGDAFGTAGRMAPDQAFGDEFGLTRKRLFLDEGYAGETLSGGMVLDHATLSSLGMEEGRTVYRLGKRQRVVLKVAQAAGSGWSGGVAEPDLPGGADASPVPLPAALPMLAGGAGLLAALGAARGARRRRAG